MSNLLFRSCQCGVSGLYCLRIQSKLLKRSLESPSRSSLVASVSNVSLPACCTAGVIRHLHTSPAALHFLDARDPDSQKKEKQLKVQHGKEYFDEVAKKARDKKTFQVALAKYVEKQPIYRRGAAEFIDAAVDRMKEFGVHKDLDTYKRILDLFPKGKMVARSGWEIEMMHYAKQQTCAIDVLDTMEKNGVMPDDQMGDLIIAIFGQGTHVFRKYQRMMYWMPKFRHINPYYVPFHLPDDRIELATLALNRMAVDMENKISVFETNILESASDDTFIVSAQSPKQMELISSHPVDQPVKVEGGYFTYTREKSFIYYVLRAEVTEKYRQFQETKNTQDAEFDVPDWQVFGEERPSDLIVPPTVHEQEDGTVLAMCITGTSSKDSLASWIKFLEKDNPNLASIPVVFLLRSAEAGMQIYIEEEEEQGRAKTDSVEGGGAKAISDR